MNLLKTFEGNTSKIPCWFMRQAGRYLPEYQRLRQQCPDFIKFCLTSSLITEATLQPLKRYDLDAAIIFSDILMIPYAIGQKVWFEENHGPRLEAYQDSFQWNFSLEKLSVIYQSIAIIRQQLSADKALIGFSGAPYTLACYMLEGKTSRTFSQAKLYGFKDPLKMQILLDKLVDVIILHLKNQIEMGCNVVQLFDSWASSVPDSYVEDWLIKPVAKIVKALRQSHPAVPIIAFPKDLGGWLPEYAKKTQVQGLSLSSLENIDGLLPQIDSDVVIQGALDPYLLVAGGKPMRKEIVRQKEKFKGRRYIFNLGHGIVPETPPSHVAEAIAILRENH